jgi:hypothetical protein
MWYCRQVLFIVLWYCSHILIIVLWYCGQVLIIVLCYFGWLLNADFPLYTKKVLQAIKQRMSAPKKGVSDTDKLQALQQKFNLR